MDALLGFVCFLGILCATFVSLRAVYRWLGSLYHRLPHRPPRAELSASDAPAELAASSIVEEPKESWLQRTQAWGKEQQRVQQAEREEEAARRGPELDSLSAEYVGGHPDLTRQESVRVHVHERILLLRRPLSPDIEIPIADISSVEMKTEEQISKDVTLTRMLLVGVWAFALRKKRVDHNEYIVIAFTDDVGLEHRSVLRVKRGSNRIYAAITKARRALEQGGSLSEAQKNPKEVS